jgi:septal ring factor EnvC (AmiA/AmiB activator)
VHYIYFQSYACECRQSSRLLEAEEQLKEKQKQVEELRLSVDDERQRRDDFQALLSAEKEQRASLEKRQEEEKSECACRFLGISLSI